MSEKITEEVKEIQVTNLLHVFYCGECGKKIMESEEYDDGWYEKPYYIEEDIFVRGVNERYVYISDFLCDECRSKKIDELVEKLLSIGFKEAK